MKKVISKVFKIIMIAVALFIFGYFVYGVGGIIFQILGIGQFVNHGTDLGNSKSVTWVSVESLKTPELTPEPKADLKAHPWNNLAIVQREDVLPFGESLRSIINDAKEVHTTEDGTTIYKVEGEDYLLGITPSRQLMLAKEGNNDYVIIEELLRNVDAPNAIHTCYDFSIGVTDGYFEIIQYGEIIDIRDLSWVSTFEDSFKDGYFAGISGEFTDLGYIAVIKDARIYIVYFSKDGKFVKEGSYNHVEKAINVDKYLYLSRVEENSQTRFVDCLEGIDRLFPYENGELIQEHDSWFLVTKIGEKILLK